MKKLRTIQLLRDLSWIITTGQKRPDAASPRFHELPFPSHVDRLGAAAAPHRERQEAPPPPALSHPGSQSRQPGHGPAPNGPRCRAAQRPERARATSPPATRRQSTSPAPIGRRARHVTGQALHVAAALLQASVKGAICFQCGASVAAGGR